MVTTELANGRIGAVVLGAGKGKRMESDLPKVLIPFHGKPLIMHVLEMLRETRVLWPPVVVVGYRSNLMRETLGDEFLYADQTEPLGTGHAVLSARGVAEGLFDHVVVVYGDMPLLTAATIDELITAHVREQATMSLVTVRVLDFDDWRTPLHTYGRVLRGADGSFQSIVELKDATLEQRAITEVNPSFFCFRADWLWRTLPMLKNENAQGEYYLTDLLHIAVQQGERVASVEARPEVALGANTYAELEMLDNLIINDVHL